LGEASGRRTAVHGEVVGVIGAFVMRMGGDGWREVEVCFWGEPGEGVVDLLYELISLCEVDIDVYDLIKYSEWLIVYHTMRYKRCLRG
jgi:hypothetical protein